MVPGSIIPVLLCAVGRGRGAWCSHLPKGDDVELCSVYPREVMWGPSPHGYSGRWYGTLVLKVPQGEGVGGGQDVAVQVCSMEMM